MSNTTTIQPSSVQSIPLQPITGRTGIADVNEDVEAVVSTSESQQTSSESQDEAQSESDRASAETDSGSAEPQPTDSTSAVDKWQRRLNAYQVLVGVLAFAGFLAMVYPQIIDHFINKDSLKLSEWTAWMTFRDECRALLDDEKDIGDDCKDRSTILLLNGSFVRRPAWLAGIFLLPLVLGFWYRKPYRSSQQQSIRRIELYRTWVTEEVARLQPYQSIGYTTGQDTVTWLKTLRKRTTVQEYTYTEIQHNENQTIISFDQMPEEITKLDSTDTTPPPLSPDKTWDNTTQDALEDENQSIISFDQITEALTKLELRDASPPPLSLVKALDNATKNALEDGNREAANESPWLPIVNNPGDYEGPMIARNHIRTVELILDDLGALGYHNFAFDHIEGRANLREYLGAAHRRRFPCDYRWYSSSPSWHENTGTYCSIFPDHFQDYLEHNGVHWLIRIREFSLDTATVCLAYTFPLKIICTWRCWQPDGTTRGLTDSQDAPCLYLMSVGERHVRVLFENISSEHYTTIMNGLRNDEQGHTWLDCCYSLQRARDVKLHLGLFRKVLSAARKDSLGPYSQNCSKCESCHINEGNYHMYGLDDNGIGSLTLTEKNSSEDVNLDYANQIAELFPCLQIIKQEQEEAILKKESHQRQIGDEQEKKSEEENESEPITMSKKSGEENEPKPITILWKSEEENEPEPTTVLKKSEEENEPEPTTMLKKSGEENEPEPITMSKKSGEENESKSIILSNNSEEEKESKPMIVSKNSEEENQSTPTTRSKKRERKYASGFLYRGF